MRRLDAAFFLSFFLSFFFFLQLRCFLLDACPVLPQKKKSGVEPPHSKGAVVEKLRVRLIERLCQVPDGQLSLIETFLTGLATQPVEVATEPSNSDPVPLVSSAQKDWPHSPLHRLSEHGTFIVTGATLEKEHFFRGEERLNFVEDELLRLAKQYELILEAWSVFSNHYHFVAHTSGTTNQLKTFVSHFHSSTAAEANRLDATPGRAVWFNYWDTQLTFEKSFFARLNYVHHNAVKHGLVAVANQYRWCSAAWFERTGTQAQVKTIYSFKIDRVSIEDDYEPVM